MDPTQIILDLCARFRVSSDFGLRLRPLVERAQKSEPDAKARIMDLVHRSFEEEARREARRPSRVLPRQEMRILSTVAGILHSWAPPHWLEQWGDVTRSKAPPESPPGTEPGPATG